MKQITMDWDTYQNEMQQREDMGKRFAILEAARYIRSGISIQQFLDDEDLKNNYAWESFEKEFQKMRENLRKG